jgi:dsRNA-specific ribonuclease
MELTQNALIAMLRESRIEDHYIYILTEALDQYKIAFTAPSVDSDNNYEMYEILGDSTANESLVWYFYETFPQLRCPTGVKIVARLKINNSGTESFSAFANSLNLLPYVKATPEELNDPDKQAKLLEDVFEAFLGVTKYALYQKFGYIGVGNQVVFNIIKTLLDQRNITLDPNELYDTKTRLKEIFDRYDIQQKFGSKVQYIQNPLRYTELFFIKNGQKIKIAQGEGATKAIQEKDAARIALEYLKEQGVETEKKFKLFCSNKFYKKMRLE